MTPKDKREPGFWITDNEIIEVYGRLIGPYGLAVYGALAMHAGQRGTCDPSIAAIAREIGASPRKVRSTIGELAAAGVISVEHRPTGKGKNHEPNAYALLPVAKLPKYTGQPTALSAEPLRHDVPKPTALSAYKEEQARTEQDNGIAPPGTVPPADTFTQADPLASQNGTDKPKPTPKPRVPLGPGSIAYRDAVHLTPNTVQRELLDAAHAAHGEDRLRAVIADWLAHGYNPKNVAGIVEAVNAGGLRTNGYHGNGATNGYGRAIDKPLSAAYMEI